MQKQDRNKDLLRPNARNQRQQMESRRDIEDQRVRNEIEINYSIRNLGHLFLLHVAVGDGRSFLRTAAVETRAQVRRVPLPPIVFAVRLGWVATIRKRPTSHSSVGTTRPACISRRCCRRSDYAKFYSRSDDAVIR